LFTDGAYIHLGRGARLAKPIHLLYVTTGAGGPLLSQPRNLVVAEEDSQAILIENYVAVGEAAYFTNALTEVVVGPHAMIEHYRLQEEGTKAYHIGGLHAHLDRDGRFTAHGIDLGGRLVRNDLRSVLDAEGAECHLNGLYVIGGRQHVDNHTHIDHAKPRGTSREFYKGVLDGRSRAVFHGRVVVHPDAQHTDAQQVNNNLLLSRDAEADTKPQLEIYADDVKCAHGATVGQLDPDALFYLRSRAVDEAAARDLLTYAFARDVLSRLRLEPVRSQLERNLAAKLRVAALHQAQEVFQ
jgi:Fe-S cluster assembly protein SufD